VLSIFLWRFTQTRTCDAVLLRFLAPTHTTKTRDEHPYPQRVSSSRSQQWSSFRPTPSPARLLETLVGILVLLGLQSGTDLLLIILRLMASLTALWCLDAILRIQPPFSPAVSACATAYLQNSCCCSKKHMDGSIRRQTNNQIQIKHKVLPDSLSSSNWWHVGRGDRAPRTFSLVSRWPSLVSLKFRLLYLQEYSCPQISAYTRWASVPAWTP